MNAANEQGRCSASLGSRTVPIIFQPRKLSRLQPTGRFRRRGQLIVRCH